MKKYILKNINPLLWGFSFGLLLMNFFKFIDDLICKIYLIIYP